MPVGMQPTAPLGWQPQGLGVRRPPIQNIRTNRASAGEGGFKIPTNPAPNTAPVNQAANTAPAVDNQQNDYNSLMAKYDTLLGRAGSPVAQVAAPSRPQSLVPQQNRYTEDPRHTQSMQNLSELAASGGYSAEDKSELRARGTSPIRATYANAMREGNRGRSLQGGYSPNMGANSARMTRERAGLIGDQVSNVNAGIAQQVAQNRVGLAPQLNAAASSITGAQNDINAGNTNAVNRAGEVNANNMAGYESLLANVNQGNANRQLEGNQLQNQILSGQANLYGTTPARAATFGNQALQQQGQDTQQGQALIDAYIRSNRRGA